MYLGKKAQLSNIIGFAILVIAVTLAIILFRLFIVSGSVQTLGTVSERHESERLKSGVNALMFMSEERSGNTILDLIGIAGGLRNDAVYLGPVIGTINVSKEIEWRMNALFGPGHWYVYVPFPEKLADIQIIIVADGSGSMKDDMDDISKNVPKIIDDLRSEGKNAEATIYILGKINKCNRFKETKFFKCKPWEYISDKVTCVLKGQTDEDWGNGLACAASYGPEGGWDPGAVRIGIPLSDELPGSSYPTCPPLEGNSNQAQSLRNGIKAAKKYNVRVFPLRANPCGSDSGGGAQGNQICECGKTELVRYMQKIANETNGTMYLLEDAEEVSEAIKDIVSKIEVPVTKSISIGTKPPYGRRVRAYEVLVPIPESGVYTKAYFYEWS